MAQEPIKSKEEALEVARRFMARGERRAELIKWLNDEDMLGLECSQTVELERLGAQDAADGWKLATWLIMSWAKESA